MLNQGVNVVDRWIKQGPGVLEVESHVEQQFLVGLRVSLELLDFLVSEGSQRLIRAIDRNINGLQPLAQFGPSERNWYPCINHALGERIGSGLGFRNEWIAKGGGNTTDCGGGPA